MQRFAKFSVIPACLPPYVLDRGLPQNVYLQMIKTAFR